MPTILQEVRDQGIVEGQRDEKLLTIKRVVALRFEVELNYFGDRLQELDFTAIKDLSDLVFEVDTLAEFETAVSMAFWRLDGLLES